MYLRVKAACFSKYYCILAEMWNSNVAKHANSTVGRGGITYGRAVIAISKKCVTGTRIAVSMCTYMDISTEMQR